MITPLRQPCPPQGGGGACDTPVLPVCIISPAVLCTCNTKSSQPGDATAAGTKPLRASESFEDFNRAKKIKNQEVSRSISPFSTAP